MRPGGAPEEPAPPHFMAPPLVHLGIGTGPCSPAWSYPSSELLSNDPPRAVRCGD